MNPDLRELTELLKKYPFDLKIVVSYMHTVVDMHGRMWGFDDCTTY